MSQQKEQLLLQDVPLAEFFMERVQSAMASCSVTASKTAEFYLVNLLQEFKKSENLFDQHGSKMEEKPLAIILAEAIKGDPNTRIRCFKKIGDLSLYMAGFFAERIKKTLVDTNYYIRMGGGAYANLSSILSREKTFAELYAELAQLFPNFVDVLTEVSTQIYQTPSNQDLLKLYERWLQTGNESLENLLNKEGIQTQDRNTLNKIQ